MVKNESKSISLGFTFLSVILRGGTTTKPDDSISNGQKVKVTRASDQSLFFQFQPKKKFCRNQVTPLIEETLKAELTEANYEVSWAATRSCQMADVIKEKVKGLNDL